MRQESRPSNAASGLLAACLLAGVAAGCSLSFLDDAFRRAAGVRTGEVRGVAVIDEALTPAAFASATIPGSALFRRADSRGAFLFSGLEAGPWLIVASEDHNGDGLVDRRSVRSVVLRRAPRPGGLGGDAVEVLSGV